MYDIRLKNLSWQIFKNLLTNRNPSVIIKTLLDNIQKAVIILWAKNPWRDEECVAMANKYQYTTQDYQDFLRTLSSINQIDASWKEKSYG